LIADLIHVDKKEPIETWSGIGFRRGMNKCRNQPFRAAFGVVGVVLLGVLSFVALVSITGYRAKLALIERDERSIESLLTLAEDRISRANQPRPRVPLNIVLKERVSELEGGRSILNNVEKRVTDATSIGDVLPAKANTLAKELDNQLEQAIKDLRFHEDLERSRALPIGAVGTHFDMAEADQSYALAFRDYGIYIDDLSEVAIAELASLSGVRESIVTALDDWAILRKIMRPNKSSDWKRLCRIASLMDAKESQQQLFRKAILTNDQTSLQKMAGDPASFPASTGNRSPEFQAISKAEGNRLDSLLVWKS
jgi:hypothetical protein